MLGRFLNWLSGRGPRPVGPADIEAALEEALATLPSDLPDFLPIDQKVVEELGEEIDVYRKDFDDLQSAIRHFLASNVQSFAWYGCLAVPAEPDPDPFGMRGKLGVTGDLRRHIVRICRDDEDLRHLLPQAGETEDEDDEAICTTLVIAAALSFRAKALFWNNLRLLADDVTDPDWFDPLVAALFAYKEDAFRKAIGLESVLERDHPLGPGAPDHMIKLLALVKFGVEDPYAAWLEEERAALSADEAC